MELPSLGISQKVEEVGQVICHSYEASYAKGSTVYSAKSGSSEVA
jgi:hypothetical protein